MEMAKLWAELSVSTRNKVGALIIKNGTIIADGFNGTPSGFDNNCEDENGDTKWFVIHAEANAILKVAKSTQNIEDSTLYTTLSPCKECCKLILQAGIKRVLYLEQYHDTSSIDFLKSTGIEVKQISI